MQVPSFSLALPNGRTESCEHLAVIINDDAMMRWASVRVFPVRLRPDGSPHAMPARPRTALLWEGDAYDAAGDYTQAQVEAKVLEVLGDLGQAFSR